MDISKLHKSDKDLSHFAYVKDKRLYAKQDCSVIFPSRYFKKALAEIGRYVTVFGVFIILPDDSNEYYLILNPTKMILTPLGIMDENINDKEYKRLLYKKDSPITLNMETIPSQDDGYELIDDWFTRSGNIPFYMGYEDIFKAFIKMNKISGISIGYSLIDVALYLSVIARDNENNYLRQSYSREQILKMRNLNYVGLSNYDKGIKNVASLIVNGSYLGKGINHAIAMGNDAPATDLGAIISK